MRALSDTSRSSFSAQPGAGRLASVHLVVQTQCLSDLSGEEAIRPYGPACCPRPTEERGKLFHSPLPPTGPNTQQATTRVPNGSLLSLSQSARLPIWLNVLTMSRAPHTRRRKIRRKGARQRVLQAQRKQPLHWTRDFGPPGRYPDTGVGRGSTPRHGCSDLRPAIRNFKSQAARCFWAISLLIGGHICLASFSSVGPGDSPLKGSLVPQSWGTPGSCECTLSGARGDCREQEGPRGALLEARALLPNPSDILGGHRH